MTGRMNRRRGGGGIGPLLVIVGLLLLVGLFLGGTLAGLLWPLIFAMPGLALFYLVKRGGSGWAWLTVPASMITTFGLLLTFLNMTGWWGLMTFAWTLVMPTAMGLGLAVYGDLTRKEGVGELGEGIAKVGVAMFLIFGLLFSIGTLSGLLAWMLPLLLVLGGIYLLRGRKRRRGPRRSPAALGDDLRSLDDDLLRDLERRRERSKVRR